MGWEGADRRGRSGHIHPSQLVYCRPIWAFCQILPTSTMVSLLPLPFLLFFPYHLLRNPILVWSGCSLELTSSPPPPPTSCEIPSDLAASPKNYSHARCNLMWQWVGERRGKKLSSSSYLAPSALLGNPVWHDCSSLDWQPSQTGSHVMKGRRRNSLSSSSPPPWLCCLQSHYPHVPPPLEPSGAMRHPRHVPVSGTDSSLSW